MKVDHCPGCGKKLDAATEIPQGQRQPKPGDILICFKCGDVLVFGKDLKLQVAQLNDLLGLSASQHRMIDQAQAFIRKRRSK